MRKIDDRQIRQSFFLQDYLNTLENDSRSKRNATWPLQ